MESCGGVACTIPGNEVPAHLALRMLSAHVMSASACSNRSSSLPVAQCEANAGIRYEPDADVRFLYNGGQFQAFAAGEPHLAPLNATGLTSELNAVLGTGFAYGVGNPWLAGGGTSTPANYALLLQRILRGSSDHVNGLKIFGWLGQDAVDASYPAAHSTPVTAQSWGYSYGHWVENIEGRGAAWDGAYSSPGALGFYPGSPRTSSSTAWSRAATAASGNPCCAGRPSGARSTLARRSRRHPARAFLGEGAPSRTVQAHPDDGAMTIFLCICP
jgi:hypothetical protein